MRLGLASRARVTPLPVSESATDRARLTHRAPVHVNRGRLARPGFRWRAAR